MNTSVITKVERSIMVRFDRIGFHKYPGAPKPVSYLELKHRHKFFFEVELPVQHENRDLEFHMVLNSMEQLFPASEKIELEDGSCEALAAHVVKFCLDKYDVQWARVTVWEDQECGATVKVTKT